MFNIFIAPDNREYKETIFLLLTKNIMFLFRSKKIVSYVIYVYMLWILIRSASLRNFSMQSYLVLHIFLIPKQRYCTYILIRIILLRWFYKYPQNCFHREIRKKKIDIFFSFFIFLSEVWYVNCLTCCCILVFTVSTLMMIMMTWCFKSLSILFKLYWDDQRMIMKCSEQ